VRLCLALSKVYDDCGTSSSKLGGDGPTDPSASTRDNSDLSF
jgi:hypothetical protein